MHQSGWVTWVCITRGYPSWKGLSLKEQVHLSLGQAILVAHPLFSLAKVHFWYFTLFLLKISSQIIYHTGISWYLMVYNFLSTGSNIFFLWFYTSSQVPFFTTGRWTCVWRCWTWETPWCPDEHGKKTTKIMGGEVFWTEKWYLYGFYTVFLWILYGSFVDFMVFLRTGWRWWRNLLFWTPLWTISYSICFPTKSNNGILDASRNLDWLAFCPIFLHPWNLPNFMP